MTNERMEQLGWTVTFDGVHEGKDYDLLRRDLRISEKHEAAPEAVDYEPSQYSVAYAKVCEILTTKHCTSQQLMRLTGFATGPINTALWRLKRKGLLRLRDTGQRAAWHRTVYEYWLD